MTATPSKTVPARAPAAKAVAGEGCSSALRLDAEALDETDTEALIAELGEHFSQLSRVRQLLAKAMADLEPSLAYPQVYAPASEAELREQARALLPRLAVTREAWSKQRRKASHAQLRRAGELIRKAEQMCEALRPVVAQSGAMFDDGQGRLDRDYRPPVIVVRPGEVMAQVTRRGH